MPKTVRYQARPKVRYEGGRARGSLLGRLFRVLVVLGLLGVLAGAGVGAYLYDSVADEVPDLGSFSDYRPKLATRVYAIDGQLIGELYREKRIFVPFERIPRRVVQAFLASEDDRFFDHGGVDFLGLLRAASANVRAGRVVQGGSTVTQQVAKALLIQNEGYEQGSAKKLSRKLKEVILAMRLEANLEKHEILALYLNHIFLGNQSYGVEAAAQNYFRKSVADLTLPEAALIAGLPQAPSRYSPFKHPKRAKERREYVLRRMLKEGFISAAELEAAESSPIVVYNAPDVSREVTPFFTEHVRRQLFERFGEQQVLEGGLQVYTSVDVERYRAAEDALFDNLRMVDRRQGYRGPLGKLPAAEIPAFLEAQRRAREERWREAQRIAEQRGQSFDLEAERAKPHLEVAVIERVDRERDLIHVNVAGEKAVLPLAGMRWARDPLPELYYESALLREIPRVRKHPETKAEPARTEKAFEPGEILLVRTSSYERLKKLPLAQGFVKNLPDDVPLVELEQEPKLESALLSVENSTGYVSAMVGGWNFDKSEFNRATQACRQPGSSFKPIVYSAALKLKGWTLASTVDDSPIIAYDSENEKKWKPGNFETKFVGEVTIRTALQNSMNVPAIKTLVATGLREVIDWAGELGISTPIPPEQGIALGQACVTIADLTEVYRGFANYGRRARRGWFRPVEPEAKLAEGKTDADEATDAAPTRRRRGARWALCREDERGKPPCTFHESLRFITRVYDRDGKIIFDQTAPTDPWATFSEKLDRALVETASGTPQLMDRQTGYLITKMMRNVVMGGTGTPAQKLGVPVAGKTGTTNDSFDAWFVGFTTELTTAAWVGYDSYETPMGPYEQGGRAALPIWLGYMGRALKGRKTGEFPVPGGITFVRIDPMSGKRVKGEGGVLEPFREGTEPSDFAPTAGEARSGEFGRADYQ